MMKVKVYRNLNNGKISIKCQSTGLVLGYCDSIFMRDVKFVVNERGRLRVIETRQKNVHAFAAGSICWIDGFKGFRGRSVLAPENDEEFNFSDYEKVKYNPYKTAFFSRLDGSPVHGAKKCLVSSNGSIHIEIGGRPANA